MTIITEKDWKLFCEDWGGTEEKGISVEIDVNNFSGHDSNRVSAEISISGEHMNDHDIENGDADSKQLRVKTCPEVITGSWSLSFIFLFQAGQPRLGNI